MILDTDVLIDLEMGLPAALAWLSSLAVPPLVAGIAALELKQGCQRMTDLTRIESLLWPLEIVWPTEEDMERALSLSGTLRLSHGVGPFDMLIGMTAAGRGLPVVTFNTKHFVAIPGVTTIQPYLR